MEQQSSRDRGREGRPPGRRFASGQDPGGPRWREQWPGQMQHAGFVVYPHYAAVPYHHDPGSGEPGTSACAWYPPAYAPYAMAPGPARMPGPVFFAAPAYFSTGAAGGQAGAAAAPYHHYWVPHYGAYPAAMMLAPGAYCAHGAHGQRSAASGCWRLHESAEAPTACSVSDVEEEDEESDGASSGRPALDAEEEEASCSSCSGEAANCWGSLTVAVLQSIVAKLGDGDVKHLRLVCRHWCGVVDHNLESLTPNDLKARVLVKRFSNLKVLHLTNCSDVRNRSLWIISKAGLNLHTLTLGDDATKPWVTNRGLECIAQMTSLTSLNLHDCGGVTNKGLAALTSLRCLASLSLRGCCRLTNAAFEALRGNSSLTSLNLYGCRLTDQGLRPLTSLQLLSLHLGNTRVRDEGLAFLAQITTLQELHFDQEELSDTGVAQLTSLTRLQSLALRDCAHVSSDSLSVLIPALPNLISLDLYKNFTMDDSQLTRCLEFLGAVTYLDLRGTPVTEDGLQQLTKLSSLQKLCLAPTKEYLWSPYLCVVSNLTQLTSLSINNCTLISFGQLETLRQLKLLRELDLSGDSNKEENRELPGQPAVTPTAINAMASITSLTSIDLSRRPVHQEHLSTLAEGLPRLHTLIIVGCPVLYTEVQSLQRRFPDLIIHRKPLFFDGSCSSSDHGIG